MIKILYVLGWWENGGIEKVLSVYASLLPKDKYRIDVFPLHYENSIFDEEMERNDVKIIQPQYDSCSGGYIKHNIMRLKNIENIASNEYDIVHYNTAFSMAYLHCRTIKRISPKTKIVLHSHGDCVNAPFIKLKTLFNHLVKNIMSNVIDYGLACSENSGKWLFSKKYFSSNRYKTLMNPLDLETKRFDEQKRAEFRELHGIDSNNYVVGTIGRFDYQKNPFFCYEIIKACCKEDINFRFIWVGNGNDRSAILSRIRQDKLENKIVMIESTTDVQSVLSAMDLFILPSRYEGLGVVLMEAQANGLKCLTSTTTPPESNITGEEEFLSIECCNLWKERILSYKNMNKDRVYPEDAIKKSGFDTDEILEKLQVIYEELSCCR